MPKTQNLETDLTIQELEKRAIKVLTLRFKRRCKMCKTDDTPLWRKGWEDPKTKKKVSLCNSHGICYSKGQYCQGCKYIYNVSEIPHNREKWECCRKCGNHSHINCILSHAHYDDVWLSCYDSVLSGHYECFECKMKDI
jgi:hypothetical protein